VLGVYSLQHILYFMLAGLLISCTTQRHSVPQSRGVESPFASKSGFPFGAFPIKKGELGNIRIGMTISEAEAHLPPMERVTDHATKSGSGSSRPASSCSWTPESCAEWVPYPYPREHSLNTVGAGQPGSAKKVPSDAPDTSLSCL